MFYTCCFIMGLVALFENIICEYILVINTKRDNEINGNTKSNHLPVYFGYRAFGSLFGSFYGGRIIAHYGNQRAYFLSAFFPIIVLMISFLYNERPHTGTTHQRTIWDEMIIMKNLIFRESVIQLIVMICLINLTPNFDSLITFYITDHLKFTTEDLSNFSTFGTVCYILGLLVYSFYLKDIEPKKFYVITNFILWIFNISFLLVVCEVLEKYGISNKFFCLFTQGA